MFAGCHHGGQPAYDMFVGVLFLFAIGVIMLRKPRWFPDYPPWSQLKKPPLNGMLGWSMVLGAGALFLLLVAATAGGCT